MSDSAGLIRRGRFSENFLTISRFTAEDNNLTFEARGLLFEILAKPPTWHVVIADLIKRSPAGKHKIYRILRELRENKYVWLIRFRDDRGRWGTPVYYVYGEPQFEKPLELEDVCDSSTGGNLPQTKNQDAAKTRPDYPQTDFRYTDERQTGYRDAEKQPLVNTQVSKQTKSKTTTNIVFNDWPSSFTDEEKKQILKIAMGIDDVVVEQLLRELVDRSHAVKNPVGYFFALAKRCTEGAFIPTKTIQRQKNQSANKLVEEREKNVREASEQRRLKMIDEHLSSR